MFFCDKRRNRSWPSVKAVTRPWLTHRLEMVIFRSTIDVMGCPCLGQNGDDRYQQYEPDDTAG